MLVVSPDDLETTKKLFAEAEFSPDFITLIDAERKVPEKYYSLKPDGAINPSIFLIDREGTLRFKYIAQYTSDRPRAEHLLEIMDALLGN